VIDWNPWDGVDWSMPALEDVVDPDLVMNQREVHRLAVSCAALQPRTRVFVLLQGVCALRPGEGRALERREVALNCLPAMLNLRSSRSDVPERFFDPGESRNRPLKGRDPRVRRRVPIPRHLVPILREHMDRYVDRRPNALVCTAPNGGRINLSNFHRDVWEPARRAAFPEESPLRRVRRHDLRHSAITAWLNSGVLLKTAQQWSGHRRLSVLLDTYLGVMTGDADVSLRRVEEALDDALAEGDEADAKPDSGGFPSQTDRRTHGKSGDQEADDGEQ
jgi:integrase